MKTLPKLLLTVVLALFAGGAGAAELNVAAAASLTDALQEIKAAYERSGGDTIVLNLGASSALARQIEEGAPVDLFLSADEVHMDTLEKRGRVLAGTRRSVLSNTLVVVVPADSTLRIASPADLVNPRIRHLALAEPQSVPAGIYAREYLRRLKLWDQVDRPGGADRERAGGAGGGRDRQRRRRDRLQDGRGDLEAGPDRLRGAARRGAEDLLPVRGDRRIEAAGGGPPVPRLPGVPRRAGGFREVRLPDPFLIG